nr:hypothetical protein RNT25_04448 [arsenite-oxidising bacterium NT-25]
MPNTSRKAGAVAPATTKKTREVKGKRRPKKPALRRRTAREREALLPVVAELLQRTRKQASEVMDHLEASERMELVARPLVRGTDVALAIRGRSADLFHEPMPEDHQVALLTEAQQYLRTILSELGKVDDGVILTGRWANLDSCRTGGLVIYTAFHPDGRGGYIGRPVDGHRWTVACMMVLRSSSVTFQSQDILSKLADRTERLVEKANAANYFADGIPVVEGVLWHFRNQSKTDAPPIFQTMSQRHDWQRRLRASPVPDPRWK